jgi:ankyrin repeat protein
MDVDEALRKSIGRRNLHGVLKALQSGANPNAAVHGNWTCLSEAVAGSDTELVRILLEHGATVASTLDEEGSTSLHEAAEDGSHAIVQRLIEVGDGRDWLNRFDYIDRTPLACAAYANHADVVEYLIAAGSDVNAHDEERAGETALASAVQQRASLRIVEALIRAGADPRIRGWMGISALDRAREQASQRNATDHDARVLALLETVAK